MNIYTQTKDVKKIKNILELEKILAKKKPVHQIGIYKEYFQELKEFLQRERQEIIWKSGQTVGNREATELSIYKQEFIEKILGVPTIKKFVFPTEI